LTTSSQGSKPAASHDALADDGAPNGPGAAAPGRRERRKQQTRDDLYEAAVELFAERRYDEVSVEDICERAEVGRATFFRFYGTKSGLLVEHNRRIADEARAAVDQAQPATTADALRIIERTLTRSWRRGGLMLRDMVREYIRSVSLAAASAMSQPDLIDFVAELVEAGQREGELHDELSPGFVAWLIVTALSGAAVRSDPGEDPLADPARAEAAVLRRAEASIETILRGLEKR
jgi:AcrR family transcriptional regulator